MKIPLNMGQGETLSAKDADTKQLGSFLAAAKKGDWDGKSSLVKVMTPLLTSLAEKRSSDPAEIKELKEKGKEGILQAVKKFKINQGPAKFKIFALDYIENSMDGKGGGFLSKLLGR